MVMNISRSATPTLAETHFDVLSRKIEDRTARLGVVGMGYVGLPLAVEFGKAGFTVTGIDIQKSKIDTQQRPVLYPGCTYE
jgi:UDP-N-acetyl-D-glucosamine dehydrogenase